MLKKSIVLAAVSCCLLSSAAVSAPTVGSSGSFTLDIRGYVPVICRASVNASQITPEEGVVSVGTLTEFCNSPNGYEVWADYSESLSTASLIVDGERVQLASSRSTRIRHSDRAGMASRDLSLELPKDVAGGSLSIRVVAL